MQADYTNGVLHLMIPVKQTAQPRRIDVGQGGQQSGSQPKVIDMTGGQQSGEQQPAGQQAAEDGATSS